MGEGRMNRCPECGGFEIDSCSDGLHCRNCGLVVDDTPISTPFLPDNKKRSASLPGTSIAGTMPMNGRVIKHYWLLTTREKNLFKSKKQLGRIASKLRLPNSVEKDAYFIFKSAVDKDLNVGRDNASMLYASVYASCIMHNIPKTPLEIVAHSDMSRKRMLSSYKIIKEKLNLHVNPIDPLDFIQRFSSRLQLKQETISLVNEIVGNLKGNPIIVGKQPKTIVASAIYIATKMTQDKRSQREVANATGVIEVTIRKRSHEILEILES
jgi:transcription initiation factor TFIIIB Brf1 subunit/transcription initiation factor TFIIB